MKNLKPRKKIDHSVYTKEVWIHIGFSDSEDSTKRETQQMKDNLKNEKQKLARSQTQEKLKEKDKKNTQTENFTGKKRHKPELENFTVVIDKSILKNKPHFRENTYSSMHVCESPEYKVNLPSKISVHVNENISKQIPALNENINEVKTITKTAMITSPMKKMQNKVRTNFKDSKIQSEILITNSKFQSIINTDFDNEIIPHKKEEIVYKQGLEVLYKNRNKTYYRNSEVHS
jgi:hypothetical protein